jgi:sensor histidine kinase YesM
MTTLREEMTYMDCYVQILQYSYHNVGNLIWEVDEELMDITLPKLILYPLVENSIFHGIVPGEHQGYVMIRIWKNGDEVVVSVADTGRGFKDEALQHVRDSLVSGAELPNHIGIHNVNSRLKLIYGNDSGLQIESEFGKGTTIIFRFLQ